VLALNARHAPARFRQLISATKLLESFRDALCHNFRPLKNTFQSFAIANTTAAELPDPG
jgi:hypothetical protein